MKSMKEHPNSCKACESLKKELEKTRQILYFYANPYTYFAVAFFPDPPCGDFMKDFSKIPSHWDEFGQMSDSYKPGKKARKFLERNPKILLQLRELENKPVEEDKEQ